MKAVLASFQKKHSGNILAKLKHIEIRKSCPTSLTAPFKVLMYETKAHGGRGAVVGEFLCTLVSEYYIPCPPDKSYATFRAYTYSRCMLSDKCITEGKITSDEFNTYFPREKTIKAYLWSVSKVIKYSSPRQLDAYEVKRPPQSWQYIDYINLEAAE